MAEGADRANGKPLKGVVLCSTSVSQDVRTRLSDHAVEMGAVHKLDLTADVTHLIVGDIRTPKYRYVAKSRPDIKVLKPDWIEEVREQWLKGDDVDIEAIEERCRLPTLYGLQVCVTGFADAEMRNKLEGAVKRHGATYSGDLTKQITHLIVAVPQGPKYKHAMQWGIACVGLKWLDDSIKRTMALDETLYDPTTAEEEQGKGAFRLDIKPTTSLGKRARETQPEPPGKRKFRRTASTKLEGHSQELWQDISAVDSIADEVGQDQWKEVEAKSTKTAAAVPAQPRADAQTSVADKLFSGWRMCVQGFASDKGRKLRSVLSELCGAVIVDNASELRLVEASSYCIIVPHQPPDSLYYLSRSTSDTVIATEWWVERSILNKAILDISTDALSMPLWKADLPDMSGLRISSTGFNNLDLRQVAQVVDIIGASYEEQLTSTTSVLISASTTFKKEKAYYVRKHNIPVVSPDWLWSSIRSKRREPFKPFQITSRADDTSQNSRGSLSGSSRLQKKRRGPFVHEDDTRGLSAPPAGIETKTLKEISPNLSPRKSQPEDNDTKQQERRSSNTADDDIRSAEDLALDISSLSRQLRASRAANNNADEVHPRRKKRTLGRAASAISNRSISAEVSVDDRLDPWDDRPPETAEQQPALGTQLGYDVPEVEAHRLQMALKTGEFFDEELSGRKLESLGTVKDMVVPPKPKRRNVCR